ncbi:MAG: hypothetical protein ACTHKV_13900 [Flavipsychrobacter sp.]
MDKNHDCISKVREQLKAADPSLGWVRFDMSTIKDMSKKDGINMTGQRIEYSYKHTKKDGTVIEKTGKSFVTHDYCPFCGKKYR